MRTIAIEAVQEVSRMGEVAREAHNSGNDMYMIEEIEFI